MKTPGLTANAQGCGGIEGATRVASGCARVGLQPEPIGLPFAGALDQRGDPYRDGSHSDEKSQEFATRSVIEPISVALSKFKA